MRRPSDDLVVRLVASRHPIENLLVQFSILSFVIMVILGVVISVILTTNLNRNFELLKQQVELSEASGVKPLEGLTPPELDRDLNLLRWTTYVAVGGGFIILYGGLVSIVLRGWRTIKAQQLALLDTNADLRAAYHDLKDTQERLMRAERLAAIGELAAGVAHDLRNPLGR